MPVEESYTTFPSQVKKIYSFTKKDNPTTSTIHEDNINDDSSPCEQGEILSCIMFQFS